MAAFALSAVFAARFRIFLYVISLVLVMASAADDIVIGCGGFVKSDFDNAMDFSRVKLKLFMLKQGVPKYYADSAPDDNGYYLIPVYDKGDYVLKIESPNGWMLKPDSIDLRIDGVSDSCSQSRDINFQFKGFSVYGRLVSRGVSEGPSGIDIELIAAAVAVTSGSDRPVVQSTKTDSRGEFTFVVTPPGEYIVRAADEDDDWSYDVQQASVSVVNGNGRAQKDLIISGYKMSGRVFGDEDEPILGVSFVIYGESQAADVKPKGCISGLPAGFVSDSSPELKTLFPLCHVMSTDDGRFVYASVTTGRYVIVPFYKGNNIKFDVSPAKLDVIVKHQPVVLEQPFKVEGFSVSGRVARSPLGAGVGDATVLLDGKKVTRTKENGFFQLENIRAGNYKIQIIADKMQFSPSTVKITPNSPNLPELVASSFQVCGLLEGDETALRGHPMTIVFTGDNDGSSRKETDSDNSGKFCIWLASGQYVARVERNADSIIFMPVEVRIAVRDAPVSGIHFVQFKAKVQGSVVCLQDCHEALQVVIRPLDSTSSQASRSASVGRDSKFSFDGVLPGEYELSIAHDAWCWQATSQVITVVDKDVGDVQFVQKGFLLNVVASHKTSLTYRVEAATVSVPDVADNSSEVNEEVFNEGELAIVKGTNKLCMKWPGRYSLRPIGCHIFGSDNHFTYDTADPKVVVLEATRHLLSGSIVSDVDVGDVRVGVRVLSDSNNDNGEEAVLGPFTAKRRAQEGDYEYSFTYWAVPQKLLELTPQSAELLFYPERQRLQTVGDCMPHATVFTGNKGLFLEGGIIPALAGAKVTIVAADGSIEPIVLETSADGKYRVGPLYDHAAYDVHVEKRGYVFTRNETDRLSFDAFKLAEISVAVTESGTGRPLAGVLISLSGNMEYRRNSLTGDAGTMLFSELGPGQFFLRAMMKEYQFSPASKMVEVKEGASIDVVLQGTRVAFSCYGSVTSLTGDPEAGIIVEALGQGECSSLQEEAKTEADGIYRVRGLKPGCIYAMRPKESASGSNLHIERVVPTEKSIEVVNGDIFGTNFLAFRPVLRMDITGNVRILGKMSVGSLRVRLSREDGEEQTFLVTENDDYFFFFSLPLNGRRHTLTLEAGSSRATYDYSDLPEITFAANESYRHFQLEFTPVPRHGDGEIAQGSYLALPMALLIILAVYNHAKLLPKLQSLSARIPELVQRLGNPVARIREEVGGSSASSGGAGGSGGSGTNGGHAASEGAGFMANLDLTTNSKRKIKPKKIQ